MENKIFEIQKEIECLKKEGEELRQLAEINRDYIEKCAQLKAIEYILMTEKYSVNRTCLALILGIQLPEKE